MEAEVKKAGVFSLMNMDKVGRALDGTPNDKGMPVGGIRKEDGSYENSELLAEYDRMGGLIRKGEDKVKTGSFYDFQNRRPREKAVVEFVYNVNGKFVTVSADKEMPGEVKAVKKVKKEAKKKVTKKK